MIETISKDWMEKLKSGDNQPLADMMQQYGATAVRRLVQKMNCPESEAKDIFVEILLNLREKVVSGKLEAVQNLPAYLFGACRNRWLKIVEQKQKKVQKTGEVFRYFYEDRFGEDAFDQLVQNEENDSLLLEKQERLHKILKALKTLTEKCQTILRLFYVEEKTMQEIAEQMQFSSADVAKTTKSRCFKKWRALIR